MGLALPQGWGSISPSKDAVGKAFVALGDPQLDYRFPRPWQRGKGYIDSGKARGVVRTKDTGVCVCVGGPLLDRTAVF